VYVFLAGDDEKINERIGERLEVRASADSRLKVDEENKWKFTETFDSLGRFSKHFVTKLHFPRVELHLSNPIDRALPKFLITHFFVRRAMNFLAVREFIHSMVLCINLLISSVKGINLKAVDDAEHKPFFIPRKYPVR
jgi:hypothetical protein